jgi:hypothetical protein
MIFGITGNKKNFSEFCCQSNRPEALSGNHAPGDESHGMFTPGRERNEQTTNSEWAN